MEPLVKALRDKESEVRAEAVSSLGKINDPRAVEKLIPALQDEKEEVRRTAAIALGKFKDPRAVERLIASFMMNAPPFGDGWRWPWRNPGPQGGFGFKPGTARKAPNIGKR